MADPDRDFEQALITLKKGTQLIKYSRKGKPKFRPFKLSLDETTLVWYSGGREKSLKLSSVERILPGQRTAVFKRYLNPEKEYLSFSLIYNNGDRSLDLICKNNAEAEIWLSGLKALTTVGRPRITKRTRSNLSDFQDSSSSDSIKISRPFGATLEYSASTRFSVDSLSDVGSERASMQMRTSNADGYRISVSSNASCSSQGSGADDIESLGDVFVWGEIWSDAVSTDGSGISFPVKSDVLIPKPLESNVVLDVHQISGGVRHVALVTRQGEVFTWGEESGGRLGHGVEKDYSRPRIVEFLTVANMDSVACGEYHTCSISTSGDLYMWGDGTLIPGLLAYENDVSHWVPKRISGPLEGLQVLSVACGTWHSALATTNGKLFTFGEGTFGVLGHGDRESVPFPKEVEAVGGLRTFKVACGLWHTAAIVEGANQPGNNLASGKLYTWGDGDKNRLGHGGKETFLVPTCVSSLMDYNFHQLACGHNMTIALTTSGHVFSMGNNGYGQLGNPQSDGKLPCLVQDRLVGEFVEEISCGPNHVAALTSRNEVFTWGGGANGRLGLGDIEDRNIPTLVESLKDRHVKNIACGSNFTACICIHKWVPGTDQSMCTACRQPFGFTRKRHNCHNCGLVHCGACSSRKALKAALSPTPGKPHRVCDSCFIKLKKAAEVANSSNLSRKATAPHRLIETSRLDRGEMKSSRVLFSRIVEPIKYLEVKTGKSGTNTDISVVRASQVPSLLQLKDIAFPSSLSALQNALKPVVTALPSPQSQTQTPQPQTPQPAQSSSNSRPPSPYSRRPSPPRSVTPVFSRGVIDSLKKTNDVLNQEVSKLKTQVSNLKQKNQVQDAEIQTLKKAADEATSLAAEKSSLAAERSSKYNVAVETMKVVTAQLKVLSEKLPSDIQEGENFKSIQAQVETFLNSNEAVPADPSLPQKIVRNTPNAQESNVNEGNISQNGDRNPQENSSSGDQSKTQTVSESPRASSIDGTKEVIEQFEPGVYVTLIQLSNGTKLYKRVRFSKRRFSEQQAEEWWNKNKERLLMKYALPRINNTSAEPSSSIPAPEENKEAEQ